MRSSFCKCLRSSWLAQQRQTSVVSGCRYCAVVTDADGAEVKPALQGVFMLPTCQAAHPGDRPQLAYIFPAALDTLCVNWVGRSADRGQRVGAAGAEGLERKSQPCRQITLSSSCGSLHSPSGDMNRSSLLCNLLLLVMSSTIAQVLLELWKR